MLTKAPRGTKDIFGQESLIYQHVEAVIRKLCDDFGVGEIRTPVFEHTELFTRGVGETTDVVQKEMYTFEDRSGRSITLRPEGTAGVVRAFVEHSMAGLPQPTKLYYLISAFRYERPQAGRFRQFNQFGAEFFGSARPECDAETIALAHELFRRLGIKNLSLQLNSLGGKECRTKYNGTLKAYIGENLEMLCATCRERYEKNPLRVLDCKDSGCKQIIESAPAILETLGEECGKHFEDLCSLLTAMGIPFEVNDKIVRGLDYYTKTVFEFVSGEIGAQQTVCGGGRYDNLVAEFEGPETPAVGFAVGVERLVMLLKAQNAEVASSKVVDIFIGGMGDAGILKAWQLIYKLRQNKISAEGDSLGRSVKAQFKFADKINAKHSLIIGDDELSSCKGVVKNMETGERQEVLLEELVEFFGTLAN